MSRTYTLLLISAVILCACGSAGGGRSYLDVYLLNDDTTPRDGQVAVTRSGDHLPDRSAWVHEVGAPSGGCSRFGAVVEGFPGDEVTLTAADVSASLSMADGANQCVLRWSVREPEPHVTCSAGTEFSCSAPLPACLTDGSLVGKSVSDMKACAPGFCAIVGVPESCEEGGRYLYCSTGCAAPCDEPVTIWALCGVVTAVP